MKKKVYLFILYFLSGIGVLLSCQTHTSYPEAMRQAERCIMEHPDSALTYLSSLDSTIWFAPKETRMYHALLTTKAKDKLYIAHTSDSLIKEVVHFYKSYGDTDKLMEAYFYMGNVYRDMYDAIRSVKAFQQAADVGKKSERDDVLGRIYGQMGTLFAYQGMYDEAMESYKFSINYYQRQEDDEGIAIALRNIARIYDSTSKQDSAIYYYEEAYKNAFSLKNLKIRSYVLSEVGCYYIRQNKLDSAKKILLEVLPVEKSATVLSGLGRIYQNVNQQDSAKYYFSETVNLDNIYVKRYDYESLSKIEASEGNYNKALNYAYKSLELTDSIEEIIRTEEVSKIHSLYKYQHVEKDNNKLQKENGRVKMQIYQLGFIGFVILFIALGYIYNLKRKKTVAAGQAKRLYRLKEEQYANSMDLVEKNKQKVKELESLLLRTESQKDTLQKQLTQSRKELLEISNQKIQASWNEKDLLELTFKKSEIYLYFHEMRTEEKMKISDDKWRELQTAIDSTYADFTNRLYSLYPRLSELELHICYLIKISLQVKDIARYVGRSAPAISACRIRLYKKIHGTDGDADIMDKFILDL